MEEKDPQVSLASGNGAVTFYITRHGQTVYNVASRVQGWCDSQLTDEGIRVARLLGRGLAEVPFAQAYCSDAGRAVQTLNAVLAARIKENPQAELPFIHVPDPRLREWCYGNLEAGPGAELHAALTRGFGEDLPFDELNRRLPQVAEVLADQDDTGARGALDALDGEEAGHLDGLALSQGLNEDGLESGQGLVSLRLGQVGTLGNLSNKLGTVHGH